MEDFKTKIIIKEAKYDAEDQMVIIIAVLAITGERKILTIHKSSFYRGSGVPGDFPDKYMYEYVDRLNALRGKTINWQMSSDPKIEKVRPEDAEKMSKRVSEQMEELRDAYLENKKVKEIEQQEKVKKLLRRQVRDELRKEGELDEN